MTKELVNIEEKEPTMFYFADMNGDLYKSHFNIKDDEKISVHTKAGVKDFNCEELLHSQYIPVNVGFRIDKSLVNRIIGVKAGGIYILKDGDKTMNVPTGDITILLNPFCL